MKVRARLSLGLAFALAGVQPAQAAAFVFAGALSGANEVPPVSTPGAGTAIVTYNDVANTLSVQAVFSGLIGLSQAAHIHCCVPAGSNAGVATPVPSFPGFPTGVSAGTYSTTLDLTLASSFNPTFIQSNGNTVAGTRTALVNGLFAGRTYFNLHTTTFPGGEIRTQLTAVPEPATWGMMIVGFAAIGGALRARRQEAPARA